MEKTVRDSTLEMIKTFEGCHLKAYRCPSNVLTIGYGHTAGVYEGMTITQAQADAFLQEDLKRSAYYVNNKAFVPITDELNINQKEALISFAYNCGAKCLQTLCENRTATVIAEKMLLYNRGGGKVLPGLVKRRKAEQALFNTPVTENTLNPSLTNMVQREEYKMDTIRMGSKGKTVAIWQIIVGVTSDGKFGSKTETATKEFQRSHNLEVDGIVGKNTWRAGLETL